MAVRLGWRPDLVAGTWDGLAEGMRSRVELELVVQQLILSGDSRSSAQWAGWLWLAAIIAC